MPKRPLMFAIALVVSVTALACAANALDDIAMDTEGMVPTFEVDPFWPKPLPNHWIMGATIGALMGTPSPELNKFFPAKKNPSD